MTSPLSAAVLPLARGSAYAPTEENSTQAAAVALSDPAEGST